MLRENKKINPFVDVKCICGYAHLLLRDPVVEGLNIGHWKCATCKRRFVIACVPGESEADDYFWPIYLEQVPSSGNTVQDGTSLSELMERGSLQDFRFQCRCGCWLCGNSKMIGRPCRCPRCGSRMIIRAAPVSANHLPMPILEFLDTPL